MLAIQTKSHLHPSIHSHMKFNVKSVLYSQVMGAIKSRISRKIEVGEVAWIVCVVSFVGDKLAGVVINTQRMNETTYWNKLASYLQSVFLRCIRLGNILVWCTRQSWVYSLDRQCCITICLL